MEKEKIVALVLAAGTGKRMQSSTAKQYMLLGGKPLVCYALEAFERSPVDEVILVTGEKEIDYCKNDIVKKYGYQKVTRVVAGGKERYHSVYQGLKAIGQADYVLIHDGARPFVTEDIICPFDRYGEKRKSVCGGDAGKRHHKNCHRGYLRIRHSGPETGVDDTDPAGILLS